MAFRRSGLGCLLLTLALCSFGNAENETPALVAAVDARIRQLKSEFGDPRFREIAWVGDLQASLSLAQTEQRPVVLFTLDGHLDSGRC